MTGAFRIMSPPSDGRLLASNDVRIEVQLEDGTWMPLHFIVAATVNLRPDRPVTATLEVLLSEWELELLDPREVEFIRGRPDIAVSAEPT